MPTRTLVTGGAGFLGSHLCERLIADGHEVLCLDNFFTGRRANIEDLSRHPRFELVRQDVILPLAVQVDRIYHLACPASPVHYQRNPVRTIRTAVEGTLNVLELARVVSNFIMQALQGQPLTVYGAGDQTRSFCYVSDLVEGFVRLMDSDEATGPVNLGNPRETTVLALARLIKRLTRSPSPVRLAELPKDDPCRRNPDIRRATELLGWAPRVSLEHGLRATIEDFRRRLAARSGLGAPGRAAKALAQPAGL